MQVYYRDQDQLPGYRYLALRAPNNEWNGFYADYVYPLVSRLIQQQILLGEVDPNRVYLMGYSHGGYGAFAIGPKMPDHFAAIHSSAAAPTDGETVPQTLRHTRFTFMIGERDLAYERAPRCQAFDRSVQELRGDRKDIFPVTMEWQDGMGHGGLPDRDKIAEMYAFSRRNTPPDLHWRMSDTVIRDFFWLSCDQPEKGGLIQAHCADNHLVIDLAHCKCLTVWLDSRMVDFHQPIRLSVAGSAGQLEQTLHLQPSLACLCDALERRGDPFRAFSARLSIIQTEGGLSLRTDGDDGEV